MAWQKNYLMFSEFQTVSEGKDVFSLWHQKNQVIFKFISIYYQSDIGFFIKWYFYDKTNYLYIEQVNILVAFSKCNWLQQMINQSNVKK